MTNVQRDIRRKLLFLRHLEISGNISKTCQYFGISRESYYRWKRAYAAKSEEGLINSKPCPENLKLRTPALIEEKIIYLRKTYHLDPASIAMYLERYHEMKISSSGVYYVLKRKGLNRLPRNAKRRTITKRNEKQVPGHHIQVDVKFLTFTNEEGKRTRRFQYTAIDDANRVRALKVYTQHT